MWGIYETQLCRVSCLIFSVKDFTMGCCTIHLSIEGRRMLGIILTSSLTIQMAIGLCIVGCGIHFLCNLQWRMSVICNYDTYTLAICILTIGTLIAFISFFATKVCYDSSKEETRNRFACLLFPLIISFIILLILEVALAISCKVHHSFDIETFREGFISSIQRYLQDPVIKQNMDRLQAEDECCGADNFNDWLETDWVPEKFNPLLNPNTPSYERTIYYPWKIVPLQSESLPEPDVADIPRHENVNPQNYPDAYPKSAAIDISELDGFSRSPRRFKRFESQFEGQQNLGKLLQQEQTRVQTEIGQSNDQIPSVYNNGKIDPHLWVVPFSCCSVYSPGPCIHDYVVQRYLVHMLNAKVAWDGRTLYQQGCASNLRDNYKLYLQATFILFCLAFGFQVIILIFARYLQTSIDNSNLYGQDQSTGHLLPCNWFAGSSTIPKPKDPEKSRKLSEEQNYLQKAQRILKKHKKKFKKHKKRVKDNFQGSPKEHEGLNEEKTNDELSMLDSISPKEFEALEKQRLLLESNRKHHPDPDTRTSMETFKRSPTNYRGDDESEESDEEDSREQVKSTRRNKNQFSKIGKRTSTNALDIAEKGKFIPALESAGKQKWKKNVVDSLKLLPNKRFKMKIFK